MKTASAHFVFPKRVGIGEYQYQETDKTRRRGIGRLLCRSTRLPVRRSGLPSLSIFPRIITTSSLCRECGDSAGNGGDIADKRIGIADEFHELLIIGLVLFPDVDCGRCGTSRMLRIIRPSVGQREVALGLLQALGLADMGGDHFDAGGMYDGQQLLRLFDRFGTVGGLQADGFATAVDLVAIEVDFAGSFGENRPDAQTE